MATNRAIECSGTRRLPESGPVVKALGGPPLGYSRPRTHFIGACRSRYRRPVEQDPHSHADIFPKQMQLIMIRIYMNTTTVLQIAAA